MLLHARYALTKSERILDQRMTSHLIPLLRFSTANIYLETNTADVNAAHSYPHECSEISCLVSDTRKTRAGQLRTSLIITREMPAHKCRARLTYIPSQALLRRTGRLYFQLISLAAFIQTSRLKKRKHQKNYTFKKPQVEVRLLNVTELKQYSGSTSACV